MLVTGATGAVGPAVVDLLLAEGCRVRVLTRSRAPLPWPGDRVESLRGDVTDADAARRAAEGVDWVFHLAALLHVAPPAKLLPAEFDRVNVEGTRVVAGAAAEAGAERLVLFSTIAVYGPTGADAVDEETPPRPDTPYGASKVRAEQAMAGVAVRTGLACATLRLAAVYGPRVKGNYARLANAIESGWFLPVGAGENLRTLVHEADVAHAALLVARSLRAAGRTYNVSDGSIHRLRDVIGAICHALGRPYPRLSLPEGVARAGARAADLALLAFGRPGRFGPTLAKYTESVAVRADRITRELGFRPERDLESGWRDALRPGRD